MDNLTNLIYLTTRSNYFVLIILQLRTYHANMQDRSIFSNLYIELIIVFFGRGKIVIHLNTVNNFVGFPYIIKDKGF